MIIWDQVRISNDGKSLIIKAHISEEDYFVNRYIKKLTVCTEDQVSGTQSYGSNFIYQETYTSTNKKEINLELTDASFNEASINTNSSGGYINPNKPIQTVNFDGKNFSNNMFFIFIDCDGEATDDTPCEMTNKQWIAVTYDYNILYSKVMNYTKQLGSTCEIPQDFVNFILNDEALRLSLETGNYSPAIQYWKNLKGTGGTSVTSKGCGCHG